MENYQKFIIALLVPFIAGGIGSFFTYPEIESWYSHLVKPTFNPPNWVFGPVWTLLYILIGISFYTVWKEKSISNNLETYKYFFIQLVLNALWSFVFFGLKDLLLALLVIIFLLISILLNIISFYRESKISAYLLIPYLLWVCFASVLNYFVFILN
ncbi:MAG: TspO/MBR family protein [Candidatus Micrarchaeia archaeon]